MALTTFAVQTPWSPPWRNRCTNITTGSRTFHIEENQPYIDGNKRTGLLSALYFLAENGIVADHPVDEFYDAMIAIAEKRVDKAGLAAIFRRHLA